MDCYSPWGHKESDMTAELKVKFSNLTDTAIVAGTVKGYPVNLSVQLSLKQGAETTPGTYQYDVVAPVIIYKHGYYRALWLTFEYTPGTGVLKPLVTNLCPLDDIL